MEMAQIQSLILPCFEYFKYMTIHEGYIQITLI
jgi:hypothetical protein